MGWAKTSVQDLWIVKTALPLIFETVGDIDASSSVFHNLAKLYPFQWSAILRKYCQYRDVFPNTSELPAYA